jgi:hypothetical protein
LSDARFLDLSSLGPGWDKRLHAKIFRFEFEGGDSVVVTGSANASRSAWLTADASGNAEMVVVHVDVIAEKLGLSRRQQANSRCRELERDGIVERRSVGGAIASRSNAPLRNIDQRLHLPERLVGVPL